MKVKKYFSGLGKKFREFFIRSDDEDDDEDERDVKIVGFKLLEVIVLIIIATVIGVFSGSFLTYNLTNNNKNYVPSSGYIGEFEEAFQSVIDNYYEDVDKEALIDAAIDGMLSILDDHTSYMDADETEQFNIKMNGEYEGIGIEFITTEASEHIVVNVIKGGPAVTAGVKVGDAIVQINDIDASTMTGTGLAQYIQTLEDNQIKLLVKRNDKNITLNIEKKLISIPSVTQKTFSKNGKKVGYIDISIFANNTYDQFKTAVEALEDDGIDSLIIDVRDNSGGYLHIASQMLEMFLSKGDILYQMQSKTDTEEFADKTSESRNYPVNVLINGNSASASEILAAAFKEVYGSDIIGVPSFGKGTVQQPSDLENGGMIKVTTDKWLTPDGNWIEDKGVEPTVKVELGTAYSAQPTDENDNQLQKALEIITK